MEVSEQGPEDEEPEEEPTPEVPFQEYEPKEGEPENERPPLWPPTTSEEEETARLAVPQWNWEPLLENPVVQAIAPTHEELVTAMLIYDVTSPDGVGTRTNPTPEAIVRAINHVREQQEENARAAQEELAQVNEEIKQRQEQEAEAQRQPEEVVVAALPVDTAKVPAGTDPEGTQEITLSATTLDRKGEMESEHTKEPSAAQLTEWRQTAREQEMINLVRERRINNYPGISTDRPWDLKRMRSYPEVALLDPTRDELIEGIRAYILLRCKTKTGWVDPESAAWGIRFHRVRELESAQAQEQRKKEWEERRIAEKLAEQDAMANELDEGLPDENRSTPDSL